MMEELKKDVIHDLKDAYAESLEDVYVNYIDWLERRYADLYAMNCICALVLVVLAGIGIAVLGWT